MCALMYNLWKAEFKIDDDYALLAVKKFAKSYLVEQVLKRMIVQFVVMLTNTFIITTKDA